MSHSPFLVWCQYLCPLQLSSITTIWDNCRRLWLVSISLHFSPWTQTLLKWHSDFNFFLFQISGAVVEISESKSSRGDRVALISGTPEQKRAAENLIQAFIMATWLLRMLLGRSWIIKNLGIFSAMVPLLSSFRFGSGEGFIPRLPQLDFSCSSIAVLSRSSRKIRCWLYI